MRYGGWGLAVILNISTPLIIIGTRPGAFDPITACPRLLYSSAVRRPRFRDHGSSGTAVQAGNPRDPVRETAMSELNHMNGFEVFTCCPKGTTLD
ncbi:unnamed protein product [Boreogadus saida]